MFHGHPQSGLQSLINRLQQDPQFIRNVTAWRTLPARTAEPHIWPAHLDPRLLAAGQTLGIDTLYTHQIAAVQAATRGNNVVLASGTASGKSLGYILPLLNTLLRDPSSTGLLVFPTKALAHDQITALERWLHQLGVSIPLRSYDGDTPQRQRSEIRKSARILVTNPDMLHLGILPHHTNWMRFFQGLHFVVLDEMHVYRGVFGSHVANVLRRLRRIAAFYGARPQCIAASATIANPKDLAENLWEDTFESIDQDGAPYGMRHVVFYNPPLVNPTLGLRTSAATEVQSLVVHLLKSGVQTIVFARSRLSVELLLHDLRERAGQIGINPDVIQGYRGGYLAQERRFIEQGLRSGGVRVVVATNALELGIDIGALDASVLLGYPGTIAAARQQMGRAGRRAGASLSVLVATPSPLDQYLISHPEYFFGRSPEIARVNPDNFSLLANHLMCAAFELPLEAGEDFGQTRSSVEILNALAAGNMLHKGERTFTWVGEIYPAQAISLRTSTPDNIVVQAAGAGVIGTVDRLTAPLLVHKDAVYYHAGISYVVDELDWERGVAFSRKAEIDYYTVANAATHVERLNLRRQLPETNLEPDVDVLLTDEEVLVRTKPTVYRRVHLATHEVLGWGEIHLPEQEMETEAFRVTLGDRIVDGLAELGIMVAPLDYGAEWVAVRDEILARDGNHCRICAASATAHAPLEVHHITPLRTFLAQYPRVVALKFAHAPENLLSLCPTCHRQLERARGARTALGGLAYLVRNLAPVFLMCDPRDLETSVEARDQVSGRPAVVIYDEIPGGVGLSPALLEVWPRLAQAAMERVMQCRCTDGCPSCVGPVGESEPGAKVAVKQLLQLLLQD
ncbi:MAG: DEAD/DEAH box helicase [Anaerolineae bacterium]|nr:DEAD/DEAH box helicase [Anaerolineae bacterium]